MPTLAQQRKIKHALQGEAKTQNLFRNDEALFKKKLVVKAWSGMKDDSLIVNVKNTHIHIHL